jgi:hypothetical protein
VALLYRAKLTPTKLELIAAWLPSQPWAPPIAGDGLVNAGAFRFDDPAGQVGMETILVRSGSGPAVQVPLTYRAGPLPGAEAFLVTTMEHSVLGRRWVYDGCGDPVYVAAVLEVVAGRARQAEELLEGAEAPRQPTATVTGSGTATPRAALEGQLEVSSTDTTTVVHAGEVGVVVHRLPAPGDTGSPALTGTWAGQDEPAVLVSLLR